MEPRKELETQVLNMVAMSYKQDIKRYFRIHIL